MREQQRQAASDEALPAGAVGSGQWVHYVLGPDGRHRPAVITEVRDPGTGHVGLTVYLTAGDPERRWSVVGPAFETFARYSDDPGLLDTWHWIE